MVPKGKFYFETTRQKDFPQKKVALYRNLFGEYGF
jgi:hypothetical protein